MPVDRSCKSAGRTFSLPAGKGSGRIGPEVLPPKMVQRSEEIHPGKTEGRDIFGRWKRPEKSMGFLYGKQSAKKQRRKMGRGAFKRRAGREGHFRLNVCCHLKTGAVLPVTAAATFLSGGSHRLHRHPGRGRPSLARFMRRGYRSEPFRRGSEGPRRLPPGSLPTRGLPIQNRRSSGAGN